MLHPIVFLKAMWQFLKGNNKDGYAGCVHFTGPGSQPCDIKVLILFYAQEKKSYLGFIPTDQAQFVERIRQVIQQQKSEQQKGRQIQLQQQQQMQQQQIPGAVQSGNQIFRGMSPAKWLIFHKCI